MTCLVGTQKRQSTRHFQQTDIHPFFSKLVKKGGIGRFLHFGARIENQRCILGGPVQKPSKFRFFHLHEIRFQGSNRCLICPIVVGYVKTENHSCQHNNGQQAKQAFLYHNSPDYCKALVLWSSDCQNRPDIQYLLFFPAPFIIAVFFSRCHSHDSVCVNGPSFFFPFLLSCS